LESKFGEDFIILDTSPGIRFWSINSLAIADILLLTLKMSDHDIDGTRIIAAEIYRFFIELGSKVFLVYNMVQGYCVPEQAISDKETLSNTSTHAITHPPPLGDVTPITKLPTPQWLNENDDPGSLSKNLRTEFISFIPCYCDIQFLRKEFLTVIKHRHHPCTSQIEKLIDSL